MARAILMAIGILVSCLDIASAADTSLTVIQFTANWCKPCQSMEPALKKLSSEGWQIRQVDIEHGQNWVQKFQVSSIPTIVLVRDGQEVDRIVGTLGYDKLLARFVKNAHPGTVSNHNSQVNLQAPSGRSATVSPASAAMVRGQSPAPIEAFPMLDMQAPAPPGGAGLPADTIDLTRTAPAASLAAVPAPATSLAAVPAPATSLAAVPAPAAPLSRSETDSIPMAAAASTMANAPRAMTTVPHNPQAAQAIATAATVRIRIDEPKSLAFGTGTIIYVHQEQALVLTCGHLFRDLSPAAKISVDLFHGGQSQTLPAALVSFNAQGSDVGLIEFRAPFAITPAPVAALMEAPAVGTAAFSMGCDQGADPTRRDTRIKHVNRYLGAANIEIEGSPTVGRSGGGLFDLQGRLIGICNAADAEDDEGIYAALPVIHEHLAALKLPNLAQGQLASAVGTPASLATNPAAPAPAMLASTAALTQGMVPLDQPASGSHRTPAPPLVASGAMNPGVSSDIESRSSWPDQRSGQSLAPLMAPNNNPLFQAAEIRCVVRQANGQESVIHIDKPSQQLLSALGAHLNP